MKKLIVSIFLFAFVFTINAQSSAPQVTTATAGKLTVNFSMNNAGGTYGSQEAIAIYITNTSNQLVNTIFYRTSNGDSSAQDLTKWWGLIGSWASATTRKTLTDASTGATTSSYLTNQVAYWGNNAAAATAVAATVDGTYTVNFEVANASGSAARKYYSGTFVKGPMMSSSTVTATTGFSGITISWMPTNTAIDDVEFAKLYNVYPNPAITSIYASGNDIKAVQICSLTGKILLSSKEQKVNVSALPKGFYLAVIYAKDGMVVKKIEKL
jgi:hypothetical protein